MATDVGECSRRYQAETAVIVMILVVVLLVVLLLLFVLLMLAECLFGVSREVLHVVRRSRRVWLWNVSSVRKGLGRF